MVGLLIKELKTRDMINRTLIVIVAPANLTFQWQREMRHKFRERFEILRGEVLRANYGSNPWHDLYALGITHRRCKREPSLEALGFGHS